MSQSPRISSCRPENLTLFHYGELDSAGRLQVEEHLQGCAACRKELAELRSDLGMLPKKDLDFSPRQIREFNQRVSRLRPLHRWPLRPAVGWSLAAATAVLLVMTLKSPVPEWLPVDQGTSPQISESPKSLPDPELLLNMELIENLDLLQELEGMGTRG